MSIADKYFKEAANKIIQEGTSDVAFSVRAKWPDGQPAHTKKIFSYIARYDLQKEFPILTLRKQNFKSCVKEILWMWQKKSNVVAELGANFWNAWKQEDGTIGKSYGYQLSKKYNFKEGYMDQVDLLLYKLKYNKTDRRMIVSLWSNEDLKDMALAPCAFMTIWDVADNKLNLTLIQRSGDLLTAAGPGGFDVVEYAILQHMIAQVSGLEAGELVHHVVNLHIYDRHEQYLPEIMSNTEYSAPVFKINKNIKNFYDFTLNDFDLVDYQATPLSKKFEVAE